MSNDQGAPLPDVSAYEEVVRDLIETNMDSYRGVPLTGRDRSVRDALRHALARWDSTDPATRGAVQAPHLPDYRNNITGPVTGVVFQAGDVHGPVTM